MLHPAASSHSKVAQGPPPARVLVCDDSAVVRSAIVRLLETDPQINVVARAANGQHAIDEVIRQRKVGTPIDVAVLDIEMPVMDGMTALPALLRADPKLRVIMASTLTTRGADIALRALRLGAADYVPKPRTVDIDDDSFRCDLLAKVKGLARLRRGQPAVTGTTVPQSGLRPAMRLAPRLLAVGSSTGGPQALFALFQGLGRTLHVPMVITQHMPATFTPILADHLNRLGGLPCTEARDGEPLQPGRAYLAPGGHHLLVEASATGLRSRLSDGPAENYCRPSVDPMLRSAAVACGGRVQIVMLTGMGHDGLAGTHAVIAAGGAAMAQDEATSVVWGMPGAIAQAGLCSHVLPIAAMASRLLELQRATLP